MSNTLLRFRDAFFAGNDIYFSATNCNGLFCASRDTLEAHFIGSFSEENMLQQNIHSNVVENDGILYFCPLNGNGISAFDIRNKRIDTYLFEPSRQLQYSACFQDGNLLYLIPAVDTTPFLIFDTVNKKYINWDSMNNTAKRYNNEKLASYFASRDGNYIYIVSYENKYIYRYNFERNSTEIILDEMEGTGKILAKNGYLLITTPQRDEVVLINDSGQKYGTYAISNGSDTLLFSKENSICIAGENDRRIYEISLEDYKLNVHTDIIPIEFRREYSRYLLLSNQRRIGDKASVIFSASGNGMIIIEDGEARLCQIFADDQATKMIEGISKKRMDDNMQTSGFVEENAYMDMGLREFINMLR